MTIDSELKRKIVHITMVGFALLIGRLSPAWISVLCLVALLNNIFVLPIMTKKGLERKEDLERGFSLGMLAYPAILLILSLIFYKQQIFMAIAWGAMAFGDGFAGLVGSAVKGPKVSWNPHKSIPGTVAFIVFGTVLTVGLIALLPEEARLGASLAQWSLPIFCGICAAALIETVPGLVDDNIIVPPVAAVVTLIAFHTTAWPPLPENWSTGLALVAMLVVLSIGTRKIDVPGGFTGGLLAWLIFLGGGLQGLLLLALFFVLGTLASSWKKKEKETMGVAQEDGGKRSVRHALSNGGVAAFFGLLAWLFPNQATVWNLALAASLASATADTVASELGTLYGKKFINVITFKPDTRGLDGVISIQGSLYGLLGACIIAAAFGLHAGIEGGAIVAISGALGNYFDSILGATLQRRGYMSNHTVNFANTAFAAVVGALLHGQIPF